MDGSYPERRQQQHPVPITSADACCWDTDTVPSRHQALWLLHPWILPQQHPCTIPHPIAHGMDVEAQPIASFAMQAHLHQHHVAHVPTLPGVAPTTMRCRSAVQPA